MEANKLKHLDNIKTVIRSILISSSNESNLTVKRLCEKYRDLEGKPIPYALFGYWCEEDFFQTMPEIIRFKQQYSEWTLELADNSNIKSAHIVKMISEQRPKTSSRRRRSRRRPSSTSRYQYQSTSSSYGYRYSYRSREYSHNFNTPPPRDHSRNFNTHQSKSNYGTNNYRYNNGYVPAGFSDEDDYSDENSFAIEKELLAFKKNIADSDECSSNIENESITFQNDADNKIPKNNNDYCDKNAAINYKESPITQKSPMQSLNSIMTELKIEDHQKPNEDIVKPNRQIIKPIEKMPYSDSGFTESSLSLNSVRKSPMQKLNSIMAKLKIQHNQTPNEDIVKPNRQMMKPMEKMPYSDSGLTESPLPLNSVVDEKQCDRFKAAKLNEIDFGLEKPNNEFYDIDEAIPELEEDDPLFEIDIPNGCVGLVKSKELESLPIPKNASIGNVFKILVAEVYDPYRFWFHFDHDTDTLNEMMRRIGMVYNNLYEDELKILPNYCIADMLCIALYHKVWHRAKILSRIGVDKVKVLFIDYGTVSEIFISDIRYMKEEFIDIKILCFRGCLDFVSPSLYQWQLPANQFFLSLVKAQFVYGKLTTIDYENRIIYMIIINTNGPIDIEINDELIEKNYAKYYEPYKLRRFENNWKRTQYFSEKRPTFELLETGAWPTLAEIIALINKGCDFYKDLDENIH